MTYKKKPKNKKKAFQKQVSKNKGQPEGYYFGSIKKIKFEREIAVYATCATGTSYCP